MKKISKVAIAVSAALLSGSVFAVDFHGYARAGTGVSLESGESNSFEKNKVGRLGNEDDVYAEFGFSQELYKVGNKSFLLDSMIASGTDGNNGWEDNEVNVAQFNVQAKGLFSSDEDAVIWAGKRYYQRHDIHITDFYYWNTSGTGGGLENLSVGPGKLSVAWIQDDMKQKDGVNIVIDQELSTVGAPVYKEVDKFESVNGNIIDVRYAGIPLWNDASLEVGIDYHTANKKKGQNVDADAGVMGTAILTQGFDGGFNKTVVQYGTNGYGIQMAALGSGAWYDGTGAGNDAKGYRLINWGVAKFGNIEFGHQLLFAKTSFDVADSNDIFSAVIRPMYTWNENMRSELELGYFSETKGAADTHGSKITIAQAWMAGTGFWTRPEIRVYASYVNSSNDTFGGSAAADKTDNDLSVGIQMEAWW